MGFSRQREQSEFVIKSKVNILKKLISILFTTLMWAYSFLAFLIFVSAIINYNNDFISILKTSLNINNRSIIDFLLKCLIFFLGSYLILTLWKIYNKRRYGKLNRRQYPAPSTDEDMLNLGLIDPIDYKLLQNNKVVTFLNNPIRDIDEEETQYEEALS